MSNSFTGSREGTNEDSRSSSAVFLTSFKKVLQPIDDNVREHTDYPGFVTSNSYHDLAGTSEARGNHDKMSHSLFPEDTVAVYQRKRRSQPKMSTDASNPGVVVESTIHIPTASQRGPVHKEARRSSWVGRSLSSRGGRRVSFLPDLFNFKKGCNLEESDCDWEPPAAEARDNPIEIQQTSKNCNKEKPRAKNKPNLPIEYVRQQQLFFAEVDSFELEEESPQQNRPGKFDIYTESEHLENFLDKSTSYPVTLHLESVPEEVEKVNQPSLLPASFMKPTCTTLTTENSVEGEKHQIRSPTSSNSNPEICLHKSGGNLEVAHHAQRRTSTSQYNGRLPQRERQFSLQEAQLNMTTTVDQGIWDRPSNVVTKASDFTTLYSSQLICDHVDLTIDVITTKPEMLNPQADEGVDHGLEPLKCRANRASRSRNLDDCQEFVSDPQSSPQRTPSRHKLRDAGDHSVTILDKLSNEPCIDRRFSLQNRFPDKIQTKEQDACHTSSPTGTNKPDFSRMVPEVCKHRTFIQEDYLQSPKLPFYKHVDTTTAVPEIEFTAEREILHSQLNEGLHQGCATPNNQSDNSLRVQASIKPPNAIPTFDNLLRECNQEAPVSLEDALSKFCNLSLVKKLGEGTYGEAYQGGKFCFKIVPMDGDILVNGEHQKTMDEMLSEVLVTKAVSRLREESAANVCYNFIETKGVRVCKGQYEPWLIKAWEKWDNENTSENDHPKIFLRDQLYTVFVLSNGGKDLEHYAVESFEEVRSILAQVVLALATAENACAFEHRDLHWGNLLISQADDDQHKYRLNGKDLCIKTRGLTISLIDFTLSRLEEGSRVLFYDLSLDPQIFMGPARDVQFETYRRMQAVTGGKWEKRFPKTNSLWIHYIADILLSSKKKYSCTKENKYQLRSFRKRTLTYDSATAAVNDEFFKDLWVTGP